MKNTVRLTLSNCFLIFTASLFIKAGCSKSNEDVDPPLPTADQYVTWNVSNIHGSMQSPADSLFLHVDNGNTSIEAGTSFNAANQGNFYTSFNANSKGTFNLNYLYIIANGHTYTSTAVTAQVTVTSFGNVGQYVVGSYNGTVKDSTSSQSGNPTYSIHGNFRLKRLQ